MDDVRDTFPALFWGYTALWTLLCVYLCVLAVKVSKLEKKLLDTRNGKSDESR